MSRWSNERVDSPSFFSLSLSELSIGIFAREKRGRHDADGWNDATNGAHERARAHVPLAYIRKEDPLLMRACQCVSERRSRASAEVIGQYQSQPRV